MLDRELERDAAAHRIAEHVDLLVPELVEHHGHVVAHRLQAERPIAERRAAVTLQVDGDHLPVLGKLRHDGLEHAGRAEPAVQQQQRFAAAADLVVIVDAVRVDIPATHVLRLHGRRCDG